MGLRVSDRKQIPLRVSKAQKKNWEDYQQELGYGSREAMIRRAVEYFYSAKTVEYQTELTNEIEAHLSDINDRLDVLRADVGDVRREQLTTENIEDIAEEVGYTFSDEEVILDDDAIYEMMITIGLDPDDELQKFIAVEFYEKGFNAAVKSIDDKDVRSELEELNNLQGEYVDIDANTYDESS